MDSMLAEIKAFLANLRRYYIDVPMLVTTGSVLTLGLIVGWKLRKHAENAEKAGDGPDLSYLINVVNVENMAELAACSKIKIKKCAEQILLDRAMRSDNLKVILESCLSSDLKTTKKAVSVIGMLVRCPEFKQKLLALGTMQTLVDCVSNICDGNDYHILVRRCREAVDFRKVTEDAIFSLSWLISGEDKPLAEQFYCYDRWFVTNILVNIMCDSYKSVSYPTRTYVVLLMNQLAQCMSPNLHEMMVEDQIHSKAADCFLKTLGDKLLAQCLLQVIVAIVSESEKHDTQLLQEVGRYKIIAPLVGCVKADNPELVYWALELLHEFAQKDMFKLEICRQPGIVKTLTMLLKENEACIQAIVLRIFSYLALLNEGFQGKLLGCSTLIQHLSVCLASGVPNVHHWALVLVHDIARGGRLATEKLLETNLELVKNILPHALSNNYITMRTALETLGFFYPCDNFHEKMFTPGSMKVFTEVSSVDDKDIREWAAAFLVRISMASDEARSTIVTDGCVQPLLQHAAQADDPSMAWEFTRTLVMVGFLDFKLHINLKSGNESSVVVDGKEYSPGKDGLNIVIFDVTSYKFHGTSFNLASAQSIKECKEFIAQAADWQLILMSLQTVNDELWAGVQKLTDQLCNLLPTDASVEKPCSFCLLTMKSELFKSQRLFKSGQGSVELKVSFESVGLLVNMAVLHILVMPLMDVFMGVPAVSNMSKVSELESLTILAQQTGVSQAMVSAVGFLEHLNEIIWNFTAMSQAEILDYPRKLVHCIGAMKIIHLMSGMRACHRELINRNTLDVLVSLLITLCQVVVTGIEETNSTTFAESPLPGPAATGNKRCTSLSHFYAVDEKSACVRRRQGERGLTVAEVFREPSKEVDARQYDILQLFPEEPDESPAPPNMGLSAYIVDEEEASATDGAGDSDRESGLVKDYGTLVESELIPEEIGNEESDFEEEFIPFAFEDEEMDEECRPSTQPESSRQDLSRSWRPYTGNSDFYTRPLRSGQSRSRTLSRALSRSLTESSFRVKSPIKSLTTDLESFAEAIENLTDYVVSTLYHMLHGESREEVKAFLQKSKGYFLLLALTICSNQSLNQKIQIPVVAILGQLFSQESLAITQNIVMLVKENATPCITLGNDCLTARNGSWTFESVFANHWVSSKRDYAPTARPRGWYFEVTLLTKGIMQIGWTCHTSGFSVEKGIGVGDMAGSVAFDGFRCKVLNGSPKECKALDYGKEWDQGDVIGCLLTWDGDVSFWMNGDDLGVIINGLDVSRKWYPAVSLTCSNQCTFAFSRTAVRYAPPKGFLTIEDDFLLTGENQVLDSAVVLQPALKKEISTTPSTTAKEHCPLSTIPSDTLSKVSKEMGRPSSPAIDIPVAQPDRRVAPPTPKVLFPLSYDYESEATTDTLVAYFEVRCRPSLFDTFEVGYVACNSGQDKRTFRVVCSRREITSCSDEIYDEVQSFETFEFIGCALLSPSCRLLLVVDGVPSHSILNPPTEEKGACTQHLIPVISSRNLDINFGESDFKFRHCNLPGVRVRMAKFHIASVLADEQDQL